ncbi:MAG: glycosyltransferase, partial [Candidatus Krumholzibacteria bacterium]|nr:glycosyltransferase [Candidatus Krumholzibacteria bacterium]
SVALLEREEDVRVIANGSNLGYARAVNQGLRAGSGDLFLVLNPDVKAEPGSIDILTDYLESHPHVGIVGSRLLNEDGSLQHSCRSFYTLWTILLRRTPLKKLFPKSRALRHHLMLDYDHASPRRVDWILGACMMARRSAVEEVGGMDERFFLYFEDVDWCTRMAKRGWEVHYEPASLMNHVHKRASAKNPFSRSLVAHLSSFLHYYEKWNPVSYILKRYRNPVRIAGLALLDLAALALALSAAVQLRLIFGGLFEGTYFDPAPYYRFMLFYAGISLVFFAVNGLYRVDRRTRGSDEFLKLFRSELLIPVVLLAVNFLAGEDIVSRSVVLLSAPLSLFLILLFRVLIRSLHHRFLRLNFDLKRMLLLGTVEEYALIERLVGEHPEFGLDLVGRLDPGGNPESSLGGVEDLSRLAREERIQEVLVASSASSASQVASILKDCRKMSMDLSVLGGLSALLRGPQSGDFLGIPAQRFRAGGIDFLLRFLKRLNDFVLALFLLLLSLLPSFFHLITAGRKRQRRTVSYRGKKGEALDFPLVLGKRAAFLSDLLNPCLYLSVLRGDLSLVGPLPSSLDRTGMQDVRPGLTGYWRIPASASQQKFYRELDRLYSLNWSPGLDFRIWGETFSCQMKGRFPEEFCRRLDA